MSVLRELLGVHVVLWVSVAALAVVGVALRSPNAALHRAAFGASLAHAVASLGAAAYIVEHAPESPTLLVAARLFTVVHALHVGWLVCVLAGWIPAAVTLSAATLGVTTANVIQWWTARPLDLSSLVIGLALVATQATAFALLADRVTI